MTPGGSVRRTGAKFHIARTPPAVSASQALCAAAAGAVIIPICTPRREQSSEMREAWKISLPATVVPTTSGDVSKPAIIERP